MKNTYKRLICILITMTIVLSGTLSSFAVFNKGTANKIANEATLKTLKAKASASAHLDMEGGLAFTSDTAYDHFSVGNMIKLMTLYLAFEAISNGVMSLNSAVKVSREAQQISVNRERVFLDAGKNEVISVQEAITAIVVAGANDACYALAEKISGTNEADFVKMMNSKAQDLGLLNTEFKDSTGILIITDGQYSCAADMCMLAYHLVKDYPDCVNLTNQDTQLFHHTSTNQPDTQMNSSNALISNQLLTGVNGLLVGYSNADKYAMAGSCEVDGERVVAVVIGEGTPELRAGEMKYLLKYTMDNFNYKEIVKAGTYVRMLSVKDGKSLKVKTCVGQDFSYLRDQSLNADIENKIIINGELVAPVSKGDIAGSIVYEEVYTIKDPDGNEIEMRKEIGSVDLIVNDDVDRASWFIRFIRKILKFFGIGDY